MEFQDYLFGFSVSSRRVLVRAASAKRAREVFAASECISPDNPYIKQYRKIAPGKIYSTIVDGNRREAATFSAAW